MKNTKTIVSTYLKNSNQPYYQPDAVMVLLLQYENTAALLFVGQHCEKCGIICLKEKCLNSDTPQTSPTVNTGAANIRQFLRLAETAILSPK